MIERKCKQCGHWNKDEDFCQSCGAALSPKAIDREKQATKKPQGPSLPEQLLNKAREANYVILKLFYYSVYGITLAVISIGAFIAWFIAWVAA